MAKSKLAEIKTKATTASVDEFIASITDEQKRKDSQALIKMMKKISGEKPVLWGSALIGFGNKRYKSPATGREVDWFIVGFSPRKTALSLYLTVDMKTRSALLKDLGKHKTGAGCLYINKLEDVDLKVLEKMIQESVKKNKTL